MMKNSGIFRFVFLSILVSTCSLRAGILYVDCNADGLGDGSSWANAFVYLSDALAVVSHGDEVRVAGGVYYPDINSASQTPTGDRGVSFVVPDGVSLLGGFAGSQFSDGDYRNFELHSTVLSGDIGVSGDYSDNTYSVVKTLSGTNSVRIDGFTITGGNANGENLSTRRGGGMYLHGTRITIANCTITDNRAYLDGGGMYFPGILKLVDSAVTDNIAGRSGGGLYLYGKGSRITRCRISRNQSEANDAYVGYGGGIYINAPYGITDMIITDSLIADNRSRNPGSAIRITGYMYVSNCTIVNNHPEWLEIYILSNEGVWLHNSIVWGNTPIDDSIWGDKAGARDCCLQNNTFDEQRRNISENPQFIDAEGKNYRLLVGSPCIDASINDFLLEYQTRDIDKRLRVVDGDYNGQPKVDMGAYEYACAGNLDETATVTMSDLAVLAASWQSTNCTDCLADYNNDSRVDMTDLTKLATHWLTCDK